MLPFNQNCIPASFGLTTVGYSVIFPASPYCPASMPGVPVPQTSFSSCAAEFCKTCKLQKRNALERQVCEVVKKYGTVEIDGKEVLGWYILLSTGDRAIIKEFGNLSGFIRSNPYLLIVNNWVKLKGESHLSLFANPVEGYCSLKDNPGSTEHSCSTGYSGVCYSIMDHPESIDLSVVYPEEKLYTHEDAGVHSKAHTREVVHSKENFWFGQASLQPQESSSKISKRQYTRPTSMVFEQLAMPIEPDCLEDKMMIKKEKNQSAVVSTVNTFGKKTVNQSLVEPHDSSAIQIVDANQVTFPNHSSSTYLEPVHISHKHEETISETWDDFDQVNFAKEDIVSENMEKCLDFEKPGEVVLEKHRQNVCQWQKDPLIKSDILVDQEYSASDICDDETFLSIKSGSYSRSSSTFSVNDSTDTESCVFEEALEDLSTNYLYNKKNYLQRLLCTSTNADQWSAFAPPDVEESFSKAVNPKMNSDEITAKQHRNTSCNTDYFWLIGCRSDKETQTKQMGRQEMGVNTDLTFGGIFTLDAVNVGSGDGKDMEDCKGNKCFSSTSHEALKQRAVKAELQLLDVQRQICWQMCWEAQQQCMEKQSLVSMHSASNEHSQDVVSFNLLALTEVEQKYLEIKKQVQSGVPLNSLVPLSMQLTKEKSPPNNRLNKCFMETCQIGIQNGSAGHPEDLQKSKPVGNNQENTFLSRNEDLQKGREDHEHEKFLPEQKRYYVHVGNLAPSVKEADLKTAFEKFNVSSIFLEESSLTSSYAVLVFTCSEKALAAVKEMDGKMFFEKTLKARIVKTFTQNFQFASQEVKIFSATVHEEKTKLDTDEPQNFNFRSQADVIAFSKPIPPNDIQSGSNCENVENVSSNVPQRVSFPGASQTFPSAPNYSSPTIFNCIPPLSQMPWHLVNLNSVPCNSIPNPTSIPYSYPAYTFPGAYPFSFHTPVNSMCKPSMNCFGKVADFGAPLLPPGRVSAHNKTTSLNSSTTMLNRGTKAVTTFTKKTAVKPVKESFSVINKSIESKLASSELASTTATSAVSSTLPSSVTAACKIPAVSDSLPAYENKTIDTSGKSNFKPAAPLRFPMFVPDSVTIPETNLLTQTSKTDLQQSGSLPLKEEEWGVHPKLGSTSEFPVYIVPNRLNLSQFNKVMNFLLSSHKNVTRDNVVDALEAIRIGRGGSLGGLTIPQIVKQASSKLETK